MDRPLKLSEDLSKSGIRILGTSFKSIDLCEDRDSFSKLMDRLGINQPKSAIVYNLMRQKRIKSIQFPIVIRPSIIRWKGNENR